MFTGFAAGIHELLNGGYNSMKRKILYISMCLPFDKAFHAGGKTFNYYIKLYMSF